MGPALNIYVLSRERNLASVDTFINGFCDRTAIEDRKDEEITAVPLGTPAESVAMDRYDSESFKAVSVTQSIKFGLDNPTRGFALYYPSSRQFLSQTILTFTIDQGIIFGASVIQPMFTHPERIAVLYLHFIARKYKGIAAGIFAELAPPRTDAHLQTLLNHGLCVYKWP